MQNTETTAPGAAPSQMASNHPAVIQHGNVGAFNGYLHWSPWVKPNREYLLIGPARAHHDAPRKLLLLLHGCGQSAEDFARGSDAARLASMHGWVVLLLRQSKAANSEGCWNWFDGSVRYGGGEVAIAVRAIQTICTQYGIDKRHTFVAGMSSGAALAAAMCAHHPDMFAGAMLHSGLAYRVCDSAMTARRVLRNGPNGDVTHRVNFGPSPSTLIVHGAQDQVVSPAHADELMRQVLAQSRRIEPGDLLPEPDSTSIRTSNRRKVTRAIYGRHEMVSISGLDHAWSGGASDLPFFDPAGPCAIELARRFFDKSIRPE